MIEKTLKNICKGSAILIRSHDIRSLPINWLQIYRWKKLWTRLCWKMNGQTNIEKFKNKKYLSSLWLLSFSQHTHTHAEVIFFLLEAMLKIHHFFSSFCSLNSTKFILKFNFFLLFMFKTVYTHTYNYWHISLIHTYRICITFIFTYIWIDLQSSILPMPFFSFHAKNFVFAAILLCIEKQ